MLEMLLCQWRKKEVQHQRYVEETEGNNLQRFKAALKGGIDRAENSGFRMVGNQMMTYEQHKLGLSAFYDQRWVLPDGIHTEPIEFHMV